MKIQFEQLDYQDQAAQSVVDVFADCEFAPNELSPALGNPVCDYAQTEENIRVCRRDNKIETKSRVLPRRYGEPLNLDVVMETGTGKTFTFIDTIYRLNRQCGLSKFIILVPSNAIRAGTMKNLQITREFFDGYGKGLAAYDYSETTVGGFIGASNKDINVLVTSFASFNRITGIIHKRKLERNLLGNARTYMEAIAGLRPVIIIDEPHRAGGEKTQKFLPKFNAQIVLRYGATFKDEFKNLVYAMDGASAFDNGLVKSITVSGVSLTADDTLEYRRENGGGTITYASAVKDDVKRQKKKVTKGDNLGEKFGVAALNGYIVEKLNTRGVYFDNGYFLPAGARESCSELQDEVRKMIMRKAIQKHFAKERELFARDIKALSLFFIDDVGAYLTDDKDNPDGELAKTFDALYATELAKVLAERGLSAEYRQYLQAARGREVRGGYFAKSNKDKHNEEEIDLILRNKEKLLSFGEPTRFIFSKWALREGWDNPNIFTLAKLAPSNSEITKLQQIGRGLRLPVNQNGRRIPSAEMESILDVVVPGREEEFVLGIQRDIDGASLGKSNHTFNNRMLINAGICPAERQANRVIEGLEGLRLVESDGNYNTTVVSDTEEFNNAENKIIALAAKEQSNAGKLLKFLADFYQMPGKVRTERGRREEMATIRKPQFAKFRDAWARINSKAVVTYDIDTDALEAALVTAINRDLHVRPVGIRIGERERAEDANKQIKGRTKIHSVSAVGANATIGEFMDHLAVSTKLTRSTLASVLGKISGEKFNSIKINPKQAARDISYICTRELHALVCQKIGYNIVETRIKDTSLTDEAGNPLDKINTSELGRYLLKIADINNAAARKKFLYGNAAGYDSNIEKDTIQESGIKAVTVFAKLPSVSIKTPVGEYNPDFAFVVNTGGGKELYLVVETKGYTPLDDDLLRKREELKMQCAERFFEALNAHASDSRVKIKYRKVFNKQALADIIAEISGD